MPWSGGTFTRSNGTYTGATVWDSDRAAAINIVSTRHDTHDQDLATGINNCLAKDGQNTPTADLPMGGFKHTGVANATARTQYGVVGQIQDGTYLYAAGSGTDTITATLSPAITAYANGMQVCIRAAGANTTTTPTLNLNSVGAITITKVGGTALAVGDIVGASHELLLRYNSTSTKWELLNPGTVINGLTEKTNPDPSADFVQAYDTSGTANRKVKMGRLIAPIAPQGRLTLTSATPVLTGTVSGATTIYYTPYQGSLVPIYDGNSFIMYRFSELSQATTDATKSPAAVGASSVYDLFVWDDAGTLRCTRGPAWSSDTARAAGGGLTLQNGIYLNTSAITNGPGASRGTWVGTVRSNGSSQIDYIFGALAASGTAAFFGVWNAYNRVNVATMVRDTTDTWTLASPSIRAANNSTTMRVTFVRGANEDAVTALYGCASGNASGQQAVGVGLDSTTAFSGWFLPNQTALNAAHMGGYSDLPGLGVHYIQAIEAAQVAGTATFYGDAGQPTWVQNGLSVQLRA